MKKNGENLHWIRENCTDCVKFSTKKNDNAVKKWAKFINVYTELLNLSRKLTWAIGMKFFFLNVIFIEINKIKSKIKKEKKKYECEFFYLVKSWRQKNTYWLVKLAPLLNKLSVFAVRFMVSSSNILWAALNCASNFSSISALLFSIFWMALKKVMQM